MSIAARESQPIATITNPALMSTVAAMIIAVSSGVMTIQSLCMVLPSMIEGHPKTMTRFGKRSGSFGLVRSDVFSERHGARGGFGGLRQSDLLGGGVATRTALASMFPQEWHSKL